MASSVSQSLLDHSFYRAPENPYGKNKLSDDEIEVVDVIDDDDDDVAIAMAKNRNAKSGVKTMEDSVESPPSSNVTTTTTQNENEPAANGDDGKPKPALIPSKYAKTFDELLTSIGFMNLDENAYQQIRANCMLLPQSESTLTDPERHLADLFKCDSVHHGCFFTTDDQETFRRHLDEQHREQMLYCFYCTKLDHDEDCADDVNHSAFDESADLAAHIQKEHGSRLRYQCNLCFYRAFSLDHILIHQALEHGTEFEETLKRSMAKKSDDRVTKFEKLFLQQYKKDHDDDDTEIDEDQDDDAGDANIVAAVCKIIECLPPDEPESKSKKFYLDKYSYRPEFQDLWDYDNYPLHCAYCNEDYSHFEHLDNLWIHFVLSHRDFPILSFDLSGDQITLSNPIDDEDVLETIQEFKKLLDENALNRSYDETLMREAFDYYGGETGTTYGSHQLNRSTEPKKSSRSGGTKRKRDDDDETIAKNNCADGEESGTTTKRRRGWLPERVTNRTSAVLGMATTALVAFGLYHFAHQIPQAVEQFLK